MRFQSLWLFALSTLLLLSMNSCSRVKSLEVTGHIGGNQIWTKENSPYLLSGGDVVLDKGASLTIQPGVTVNFIGNNYFIVEGRLDAQGTESDPIIFKPVNLKLNGNIRGLKITGNEPTVISNLKYIQIHDADFGIYIDGANVRISYSIISANGEGIHLWNSPASLEENLICYNRQVGLYIGPGKPVIRRNRIEHNIKGMAFDYEANPVFTENDIDPTQTTIATIQRCTNPFSIANNWWGTTNASSIKSGILPQGDNGPNFFIQLEPLAQKPFH